MTLFPETDYPTWSSNEEPALSPVDDYNIPTMESQLSPLVIIIIVIGLSTFFGFFAAGCNNPNGTGSSTSTIGGAADGAVVIDGAVGDSGGGGGCGGGGCGGGCGG